MYIYWLEEDMSLSVIWMQSQVRRGESQKESTLYNCKVVQQDSWKSDQVRHDLTKNMNGPCSHCEHYTEQNFQGVRKPGWS